MSYQNIEEYFAQIPDDAVKINVKFISDHLPDLSRFYKLKILNCPCNQLTCLPLLPSTLTELICFGNKLTHLPLLPSTLKELWCNNNLLMSLPDLPSALRIIICYGNELTYLPLLPSTLRILECNNNQLTCLPDLPYSIELLNCFNNNQLTCLPALPSSLEVLHCYNNPFLDCYVKRENYLFMTDYIAQLRKQIKIVHQFRELFYALKYKKQLKKWLWHIREPKIRNKYHPSNLMAMLEEKEDMTLDELDELLEKW
jgi:hypothetical protein